MSGAGACTPLRVGIIGGGISGLASAWLLAKAGHSPVIFEASGDLGGLGGHFEHDGHTLEKFYHVLLPGDSELLSLIDELGLSGRLVWRHTGMGFYQGGSLYPLNTAADVLRFGALSVPARLRLAAGAAYLATLASGGEELDRISAAAWLRRIFGETVFRCVWHPLLRAKFGDLCDAVPAYWFWSRLRREKNGAREIKGYIHGGYRTLTEALRSRIVARGGEIRLHSPVASVEQRGGQVRIVTGKGTERLDAAISTLPLPLFRKAARGGLSARMALPDLPYQGIVNVVLVSRKPVLEHYWTAVVDRGFPFQGIVESTKVVPLEQTGGRHLIYVMNYCHPASAIFNVPDEELGRAAFAGLARLCPRFDPGAVEAAYVFRAPYVEPVWPLGYLAKRPAPRVADTNVYLATTAQAYPRVNAWNTSVGIARECVSALLSDLAVRQPGAQRVSAVA